MAVLRFDKAAAKRHGETVDEFVARYVTSPQCDDVVVRTIAKSGQRSVEVGTTTLHSDRAVKSGLPLRNVLYWAAAKALYAAANILLELGEDKNAQVVESLARYYWSQMRKEAESRNG